MESANNTTMRVFLSNPKCICHRPIAKPGACSKGGRSPAASAGSREACRREKELGLR